MSEVQAAVDGRPNDKTGPLLERVIAPLYAAYAAVWRGRATCVSRWTSTCRNARSCWTTRAR